MVLVKETTATDIVILSITHRAAKRRPWRKRLDEV
jgi:hypothetical protein